MDPFDPKDFIECAEIEFEFYEEFFDFPTKSLAKIFHEDDFSFFVKYSSLLELILGQAIFSQLHSPPSTEPLVLSKFLANLDINNHRTGKIKLAYEIGLLNKEEANFSRKFTERRNLLVHSGNLLYFNLRDHVATFDTSEMLRFIKTFKCDEATGDQSGFFGDPINLDLVRPHPKEYIMAGFMGLLCNIRTSCLSLMRDNENHILIHRSFENQRIVGTDPMGSGQ